MGCVWEVDDMSNAWSRRVSGSERGGGCRPSDLHKVGCARLGEMGHEPCTGLGAERCARLLTVR